MTFAAGETEQTFTILVTPDALDEGTETVELAFGDLPAGVTAGINPTTAVRIADSEAADIGFSADRGEVSEGGEVRLTFAIHNDVTFQRTETINLAITGTATPGVDFTLVDESGRTLTAPYAIAFPPGVSSVTATVHVTDDIDPEPDEDIAIAASSARRGEPLGTTKIVVQASSGSGPPPEPVSFSDVPEDAWYADHVQRIAGLGITTGYPRRHVPPRPAGDAGPHGRVPGTGPRPGARREPRRPLRRRPRGSVVRRPCGAHRRTRHHRGLQHRRHPCTALRIR